MDLINAGQTIFSNAESIALYLVLTAGTAIACLCLFRAFVHADAGRQQRPERTLQHARETTSSSQGTRRLHQVFPANDGLKKSGPGSDIDIIAIHGLDTNSLDTWRWRVPNNCKTGPRTAVNWLSDPDMLPAVVGRARIFTCDWPAELLQQSSVPMTLHECARSLRDSILQHQKKESSRPILFIASCLGGIILMKALEIDNQHPESGSINTPSFTRSTCGIVFLATPFRGTAFENMPSFLLKALRFMHGRTVTALIDYALCATPDLDELSKGFITRAYDQGFKVSMFWEAQDTVLLRKFYLAWIVSPQILTAWVLVSTHSATLSNFHSQRLDRNHVMMNKFGHSNCTAYCKMSCTERKDFDNVSGKIVEMLQEMRKDSPIQQADNWIRDEHYTEDRLKIERLSGDLLPLERCYINLAIVEHRKTAPHANGGPEKDSKSYASPFSLSARLQVETPDKSIQIGLSSLFDLRKDSNDREMQPKRILIRGRAGIGKTTLCKKIIYEFVHRRGTFDRWEELFDRVLWVSLRRLKDWQGTNPNLEALFFREFFSTQHDQNTRFALSKELQRVLKQGRTLFLLDGLDEVAQELAHEGDMSKFLKILLGQPNVIITSRPHVSLPADIKPLDLELETVGFYPDQVEEYLQATFADPKKVEAVQLYLQKHYLIQGLVRIPIQLDALCYTWDHLKDKAVPQTMTATYRVIEESLWKKDILRLEKKDGNGLLTKDDIKLESMNRINSLVKREQVVLEGLAFAGLHSDVINFDISNCEAVFEVYTSSKEWISWNTILPRLSVLRTSDLSKDNHGRSYHFLHLTFQEFFAARYFTRQWKAQQDVSCLDLSTKNCAMMPPATFLKEHRYDPQYNIFWRFVAGLLDADCNALSFFQAIEEEPRDLLGPTHQRLIMHCLSETEQKDATFTELRLQLEKQLEQWMLFECNYTQDCRLAGEMECPEQVLVNVLTKGSEDARLDILNVLKRRASVPSSVIAVAVSGLKDCISNKLYITSLDILRHHHNALPPDMTLQAIAARLEDEDSDVRRAAIKALQGWTNLTEEMLQAIAARLEDEDSDVRWAAIKALQGQDNLTEEILQATAARLEDEDSDVRREAIEALQGRTNLKEEMLQAIAARLEHRDSDVQWAAIKALQGRTNLTEEMLQAIAARLEDEDRHVRLAAIKALQGRTNLTEEMLQAIAARLEHRDSDVREAAIEALQDRTNLTEEILQAIAARLEHKDWHVRLAAIKALQGRTNLTEEMLQAIAARLEDEDSDVRWAAIKALQGRTNLTEEMLQAIAARLEDEDSNVRWAAIKVLQGRTNLTEEILQAIAARLKHRDSDFRWAAIEALQGQTNLTEEMLQAIAARLEDEDSNVQQAATEMLVTQAALSLEVLRLYIVPLYKALLQKSFKEHLYWCASDRSFIGVGLRQVSLSYKQENQLCKKIWETQNNIGVPFSSS
ncbi:hypothetical protein EJ07DRAFT_97345 [Lizonia empirigonia]|nr:hypothetical protein EJ07DRAFT_97345 [Lizonia empirigonia]